MKTVAELIEWYNQQNETKYHRIEVHIKKDGKVLQYENFHDVSGISYIGDMMCFYGKNTRHGTERYIRIDNAYVIRSEV